MNHDHALFAALGSCLVEDDFTGDEKADDGMGPSELVEGQDPCKLQPRCFDRPLPKECCFVVFILVLFYCVVLHCLT